MIPVTFSGRLCRVATTFALILALAPMAAADETRRLGDSAIPTAARVDLRLDPDLADYSGSVVVEIEIPRPTRSLRFHAEEMTLERVELSGGGGRMSLATEVGERGLVVATVEEEIAAGAYTLEIDFRARFGTRTVGLYRVEHGGRGYLFTQFQATDARRAFPCWDEPAFKIPYRLRLEVPAGLTAVSNSQIASATEADGWRTVTFAATPPLPSYLVAIAVGPFDRVEIPGLSVPGRIYTPAGQGGLTGVGVEMAPPILAALERYFGRPYPYAKLDFIAIPEFWPGAMENAGAVTFADRILLVDPQAVTAAERRDLARYIAHELAHMWFGDLVTMRWWDDLWLNESFADWLAFKIAQELYPQFDYQLTALRGTQDIMETDARPTSPPIHKPVETDADAMEGLGLAYAKGRAILGMIEQWVGAETFRKGVLDYLETHAWGNATGEDLWAALSKASGADVAGALRGFVDQPGLPLIEVEVAPGGVLEIRQRRFLNAGVEAPAQRWKVPIVLAVEGAAGIENRSLLLTESRYRLDLGGDVSWVLPNAGARGYYRWRVPTPMLRTLAERSGEVLQPGERIALLGNAGALLDAGVLGGGDYLEVLNAFADDPEPEVLSALIDGLAKVEDAFVPDDRRDAFAAYVRSTLGPARARFGLERRPGEAEAVSLFRPRLFAWLGDQGDDPEVRRYAAGLARAYRTESGSVDPSLAGVALWLAAIDGDRELFDAYRRGFEQSEVPADRGRYLQTLGAFRRPELRAEALAYVLSGPLRPNELFAIPGAVADREEDRETVFRWTTEHYAEITARIPPDFVAFMPFVASGCSPDLLARARTFFSDPLHRVDGTEKQLAKVADQVNDCAALRRREGRAVGDYLRQFRPANGQ